MQNNSSDWWSNATQWVYKSSNLVKNNTLMPLITYPPRYIQKKVNKFGFLVMNFLMNKPKSSIQQQSGLHIERI
jgi:hypothetical protein